MMMMMGNADLISKTIVVIFPMMADDTTVSESVD